MNHKLADHLQVWGLEGDFIIFADASLGFGLEFVPVDISCWDAARINHLADQLNQFSNGLPNGMSIQFSQEISNGNEHTIKMHSNLAEPSVDSTAQALTIQRIERLRSFEAIGLLPKYTFRIFARLPFTKSLLGSPRIFSKTKSFEPIAQSAFEVELHRIQNVRNDVLRGLSSVGINSRPLSADELVKTMYRQWNPTRPVELAGFDPDNIRNSILFTDVSIYEKGFCLGDVHSRVVSLKVLPDQTYSGMSKALSELPFNSKLFLTINVPDQQKELESLQTQRRLAFSMARGKKEGVSDIECEAKFQDLETLLSDMIAQGEKVFHVSLSILLQSTDQNELEEQVTQALMKLRELGASEGMLESLAAFDIFAEFAIPNSRANERSKRVKTSNLTDLLPLYGAWQGHDRPSILLRSRNGSLLGFDPFSSTLTNYNQIVSGGSGSGKSFLTNVLLLQMLKEKPQVFVVDIGASYRKLCDNLSGQYIALGVDNSVSINPFDLPKGIAQPPSAKIKFLVGLVEMMTKEDGESGLKRLQKVEIEEAIQKVYEGCTPSLSSLKNILEAHSDIEIRKIGRVLSVWCGESPYGRFVDRPTTIELEKDVVCFDLKGMENYPDLQAICLYIMTDFIWQEVQKDRSRKKFVIFDECWKLLEDESGMDFIAEVFRTFRKYYASAIAISQNIDDFAKSKVATAILSNSAVKWILMQKGADQARLREVLQLNESEMSLIASLHQERGTYSEAFLMAGDDRSLVIVEPTPLEYWLATTDPRDLAAFEEARNRAPESPNLETLMTLSQKYPKGIAALKGAR